MNDISIHNSPTGIKFLGSLTSNNCNCNSQDDDFGITKDYNNSKLPSHFDGFYLNDSSWEETTVGSLFSVYSQDYDDDYDDYDDYDDDDDDCSLNMLDKAFVVESPKAETKKMKKKKLAPTIPSGTPREFQSPMNVLDQKRVKCQSLSDQNGTTVLRYFTEAWVKVNGRKKLVRNNARSVIHEAKPSTAATIPSKVEENDGFEVQFWTFERVEI